MIDATIGEWTARHTLDDVLRILGDADIPTGRIYSVADIVHDEQYLAREMIQHFELPDGTPIDVPGIVPKLNATPGQTRWLGPKLGAHPREDLDSNSGRPYGRERVGK